MNSPVFVSEALPQIPYSERVVAEWRQALVAQGADALAQMPIMLHISAPSGCGKQTAIEGSRAILTNKGIAVRQAQSVTTRRVRPRDNPHQYRYLRYRQGEDMGSAYGMTQFGKILRAGEIIECDYIDNGAKVEWYGLTLQEDDRQHPGVTIIETSVDGMRTLKQGQKVIFERHNIETQPVAGLISVYILPPGDSVSEMQSTLEARIIGRGDGPEAAHGRVWSENSRIPAEIAGVLFGEYPVDYVVVNDDIDRVIGAITDIAVMHLGIRKNLQAGTTPLAS